MNRREYLGLLAGGAACSGQDEVLDIRTVEPDLIVPAMSDGEPAPGRRVRGVIQKWTGTEVHHALYLPRDWNPGRRYPVLVEYAGNGNYRNAYGDVSTGEVEGSKLGYGLSAGSGYLWLCLPYVNVEDRRNQLLWWGDVEATVAYCRAAVEDVCARWGGDETRLILCGFSRGSIGCNFLGLHDDGIAKLWRGFFCYSHYDGVRENWPYAGADRRSALRRLERLNGRPQFICHERSVVETENWLKDTGVVGRFTFESIPFRNHNDAWTLRDIRSRQKARSWLAVL